MPKPPKVKRTAGTTDQEYRLMNEAFEEQELKEYGRAISSQNRLKKDLVDQGYVNKETGKAIGKGTAWNPSMVTALQNSATNKGLKGNFQPSAQVGYGQRSVNPATNLPYANWTQDPNYTLMSGQAGAGVYKSNVDPTQNYMEAFNPKTQKTDLLSIPTTSYKKTEAPIVEKPNLVNPTYTYINGNGTDKEQMAAYYQKNPTLQPKANGGLVKHIKGYYGGGTVTGETAEQKSLRERQNAGIGAGLQVGSQLTDGASNMWAQDEYGRIDTGSKAGDYGVGIGTGALKGASKGAAIGSIIPGVGTVTGAAIGLGIGGLMGGIKTSKDRDSIEAQSTAEAQAKFEEQKRLDDIKFQNNRIKAMENQVNGMKDGGVVKGPGTGKSDSIDASVKAGSFVVPVENVPLVKKLVPPSVKKKANLNQKGGEEVALSDGEVLLDPADKKNLVKKYGKEVLKVLAPNADKTNNFKNGGDVDADKEIAKIKKKQQQERERYEAEKVAKKLKAENDKKSEEDRKKAYEVNTALKAVQYLKSDYNKYLKDKDKIIGETDDRSDQRQLEYLEKIKAAEERLKKASGEISPVSNNATTNSKTKSDFTKAMTKESKPFSTTGEQIEKNNTANNNTTTATTRKPAGTGVGAGLRGKVKFNPDRFVNAEDPNSEAPEADLAKAKRMADDQEAAAFNKTLNSNTTTPAPNSNTGNKNNIDYAKLLNEGKGALNGLANYILPYKQTQAGLKFLAEAGERPVDAIDPGFQSSVGLANANAKFGFTAEEQAAIDMQNAELLSAQKNAARNYSGGSASNAYNMERDASNQSFARGLQAKIQNRQLQMDKQNYADNLNVTKADMSRRLFGDRMTAWQQNQQAGAGLVGAGLKNMISGNRYNAELAAMKQASNFENNWINNV